MPDAAPTPPIDRPPVEPLSLSIVLPCYNEAENVRRVVEQALTVGRGLARELEVIIVNDGSRDGTGSVADALAQQHREVRVVHHERNLGYGGAVASGLRAARRDWVFFTDGDGQFDLAQVQRLLPFMRGHDLVTGYRLDRQDGPVRRLNGWLWTRLVNLVLGTGVRDVDCAFKVIPRVCLERIELCSRGALVSAELLARARRQGLSVAEVGVHHLPRLAGRSTGGRPGVILRALIELWLLRRNIRAGQPRRQEKG
jgi:glycosyltransferase involved in cell wall biosynthesis